jgi:hypothetical protein
MRLALGVSLRFGTLDEALAAKTANISREGLLIAMDTPKPLGTIVKVKLEVGQRGFQLEGVVIRSDDDGIGVHVTEASEGWVALCEELERRRNSQDADTDVDVSDL